MISVKKQGTFEVFSRGVEEPWSIWRDGKPFKQVWTWDEVDAILKGAATKPVTNKAARLSKSARMKLGSALRRMIKNAQILMGSYRSMRHDDYQRAGEAAIEASGLYGRVAAQASDAGVEIFELVDGTPHVDQGALVRWNEED